MYFIAGCGFRPITESAIALDFNLEYIEKNRAYSNASVIYLQGDLRHLPFRDSVFDRIRCWDVLEHVSEKEIIISELHRTAAEGAIIEISAGLRACDQLLGKLSRTYYTKVTKKFHQWAVPSAEYLEIVARYFEIDQVRYPCNAYVFIVVLLLDLFRVDVNDAGEYLGQHAKLILRIARFFSPLLQPLFNIFSARYHEYLSQTVIVYAKKQSSEKSLSRFTVIYGSS